MTDQITLEEALRLVDFGRCHDGSWFVRTVKGDCITVKGHCDTVEGSCHTVKGYCHIVEGSGYTVKGDCDTVGGNCNTVKGDCGTVGGRVLTTINGRQWRYETPKEKVARLIEEGAPKEELYEALEELND